MEPEILRVGEVLAVIGLRSRSTLWKWVKLGTFPAPVHLGSRHRGWRKRDVERWLDGLADQVA